MLTIILTVLTVLVLGVLALLAVMLRNAGTQQQELLRQNEAVVLLGQQIESLREAQDRRGESIDKNLRDSQQNITQFLQNSQKTLTDLHKNIGEVQSAGRRMLEVGEEVRKLQDIFKNPKQRGQLGEFSLQRLLEEVLPAGSFKMQHQFRNNRIVDALIVMPGYSVPIDAKFPLPNFEQILAAENDAERDRARRQFHKDVTTHIDKIAGSYILPDEGTLDLALMYVPAENVYYEIVTQTAGDKADLISYAQGKRVIPVSPNLLYAYLMTIVMGLKGMQIEKQAAEIRRNLGRLAGDFSAFVATWDILGKHLRNAAGQYDTGRGQLDKFGLQLEQIHHGRENESLAD